VTHPPSPTGISLHVDRAVDATSWDEAALALGAPIFHSSAWSEYRSGGSRTPLFFRWTADDQAAPTAIAIGTLVPAAPGLGRCVASLQFDSAPVSGAPGLDLLTPVVDWALAHRTIAEVRLGSFGSQGAWRSGVLPNPVARIEFLVAPSPRADIVRRMHRLARRSIRKAEGLGLLVRQGRPEDVHNFARLHRQTLIRLNRRKGVSLASSLDVDAVARLIDLGAASLYLTEEAGDPVVGWLFGTFGADAYSLLSGNGERALETGAVPLTLAHALSDLFERGFTRLNVGGVEASARAPDSPDHGLFAFKAGLGTTQVERTSGRVVCRPLPHLALSLARRVVRRG